MSKMSNTLDDINDILIVRKITEVDPNIPYNETIEVKECLCFKTTCDCEKKFLVEEQEAIVRKQLQMLQADERGKQALISEIAALKEAQEQRAELLRNRQHARDIENERARRIASLPPPLPKSVKELLRKHDNEPKTSAPDVQMPDELKTAKIKLTESSKENKENILDPEEFEARQKMQEEWQIKAKKRFNVALKKDRQKEEYSNIMRQIQNAELQNRREMAKNVSSDKGGMPCPLSDRLYVSKKQADMEEAAEKVFKKISTKEHAVEDVEGYEDHYEEKYKKIDSMYESKMIDCVPDFIKENYEYLLEDESKFQGGRNFSELDDSGIDIFNQAYIETPPDADKVDGSKKIDLAISHLDKLRSELQTEYEQTVKPLLIAATEVPKKKLSDKAVETDSTQLSAEDKAVETDMQYSSEITSPPPYPPLDFRPAYKRRYLGPILNFYQQQMNVPDMHQRNVHFPVPTVASSEGLATGSWSSSSYCSLPSKHGIPTFSNAAESVKCDICVAEKKDDSVKEVPHKRVPMLPSFTKKSDKSTISTEKTPLSEYVRQVAEKYLVTKSPESSTKAISNSVLSVHSKADSVSPAFEKEVICKSKAGLFIDQEKSKEFVSIPVKENSVEETAPKSFSLYNEKPDTVAKVKEIIPDSGETSNKTGEIHQSESSQEEDVYKEIKSYELSKSPLEYSPYDLESKRIQAIQQVLARRIPCFTLDFSPKPTDSKDLKDEEPENLAMLNVNRMVAKPHVYHELSTIQELDSAVTASSLHLSHSKLSDTSEIRAEKKSTSLENSKEELSKSAEKLKMASLLDPPDSEISELAKSIHFVEIQDKKSSPLNVSKSVSLDSLTITSVSSKDNLSTPSHVTDSNSSAVSHGKVLSSTLSGNHVKYPFLKDTKNLPKYFEDISAIQQQISGSDKSSSSASPSESMPSSLVPSTSQSLSSVIHKRPDKKEDTMHPIISGYISDLETPATVKSKFSHATKENKGTIVSSYISDAETPEVIKSYISHPSQVKKDTIVSGYISDVETPEIRDVETPDAINSNNFYLMTPHSDISSPNDFPVHVSDFGKNIKRVVQTENTLLKYDHAQTQYSSSESNGNFKPMTPHSNISSPSEFVSHIPKNKSQGFGSSAESFKALTPHSNISSPSDFASHIPKNKSKSLSSSAESFKALTPHSNISSPSEFTAHIPKNNQGVSSSAESFKALTPHSNISSPSEFTAHIPKNNQGVSSSAESFKALTPLSNISSPGGFVLPIPSEKKNEDVGSSVETFYALTPHSNISSPNEFSASVSENKYQASANNAENFKAITTCSNISTSCVPTSRLETYGNSKAVSSGSVSATPPFPYQIPHGELELRRRLFSSSSEFPPVTIRLDISTSSVFSTNENQLNESKKSSHLSHNPAFKAQILISPDNRLEMLGQNQVTVDASSKKTYLNDFKKDIEIAKTFEEIKCKRYAHTSSSDFFTPHISNLPYTGIRNDCEGTLTADSGSNENKSKSTMESQMGLISSDFQTRGKMTELKNSCTASVSSSKEILVENGKEKHTPEKSEEFAKNQNAHNFEIRKGFIKQYNSLKPVSSTSSSTENLSEISESKVLYQSTPIKNFSTLIQEEDMITDENLTLLTTTLTSKIDSPVKKRDPSTSRLVNYFANKEIDTVVTTPENEPKTPSIGSPQLLGSVDTPSLISFLQHEQSCMQVQDGGGLSTEYTDKVPNVHQNETSQQRIGKEVKRSLFKRNDYKQRTKRLWSNLSEVKKKNLVEQTKKEREINRLKAKEYAKKLTPKGKK